MNFGFFFGICHLVHCCSCQNSARTSHRDDVERVSCKSRTALSGDYSIGRLDDMSSVTLKAKSDGCLVY